MRLSGHQRTLIGAAREALAHAVYDLKYWAFPGQVLWLAKGGEAVYVLRGMTAANICNKTKNAPKGFEGAKETKQMYWEHSLSCYK